MSDRYRPNEPACPIPLELLALLLRSPDERVVETVRELSPQHRATLATYCAGRAHMRRIGLVIATQCSEHALWEVAGRVGLALFEQSQDQASFDRETGATAKRKVSLARVA
jgi:hypothetical protein